MSFLHSLVMSNTYMIEPCLLYFCKWIALLYSRIFEQTPSWLSNVRQGPWLILICVINMCVIVSLRHRVFEWMWVLSCNLSSQRSEASQALYLRLYMVCNFIWINIEACWAASLRTVCFQDHLSCRDCKVCWRSERESRQSTHISGWCEEIMCPASTSRIQVSYEVHHPFGIRALF